MSRAISWGVYLFSFTIWIILSACTPWVLSDDNVFLKSFINHDILTFLGLMVAIALLYISNLHFALNRLEEKIKRKCFTKTRNSIKSEAYWMIGMFFIAAVIVVLKPLVIEEKNLIGASLFNGGALIIMIFDILVLIDIVRTTFKLEPNYEH